MPGEEVTQVKHTGQYRYNKDLVRIFADDLIFEKSCRNFQVDISQGSCQVLLRIILNFDQVPDKIFD